MAVQFTLRVQLLSNPQIPALQGDTVPHLGQATAALLTPQGTNGVGSLLILLLNSPIQSSYSLSHGTNHEQQYHFLGVLGGFSGKCRC